MRRPNEAAQAVEEAVELALRVVEATRAAPAVGAAVDGLPPVVAVHAPQLARQQVGCRRPAHRDEGLRPAAVVRPRAAVEPAGADHRLGDPGSVPEAPGDVAQERRGIRIVPVRVDGDDGAPLDLRLEGAPVRRVEVQLASHLALLPCDGA